LSSADKEATRFSNWFIIESEKFKNINTNWISELKKFDYWDLLKIENHPVENLNSSMKSTLTDSFPVESDFWYWIKIHIIKANENKVTLNQAITESLHFADILMSASELSLNIQGLIIKYNLSKVVEFKAYIDSPISENDFTKLKRVLFEYPDFLNVYSNLDANVKKDLIDRSPFGLCFAYKLQFGSIMNAALSTPSYSWLNSKRLDSVNLKNLNELNSLVKNKCTIIDPQLSDLTSKIYNSKSEKFDYPN
jgi:hypothetical protein